jgi:hypothetical protein
LLITSAVQARSLPPRAGHILIDAAIVLDFFLVLGHGAEIHHGIVLLPIEIAAEPICDHRRSRTEGPVKQILPAGDLRDIDSHLRPRLRR